jgi:hypothetical protein
MLARTGVLMLTRMQPLTGAGAPRGLITRPTCAAY